MHPATAVEISRTSHLPRGLPGQVDELQTLVVAIGAGLGVWGVVNLMEGYGNDNRAMRS